MEKCLSILLTVLLAAGALIGCAGQSETESTDVSAAAPGREAMPEEAFTKVDYEKLLALQFDDYRHMTVSEFQNRVWETTDTPEYMELLGRFSKSEKLYQMKDRNETAWFLFYILEPLTAENWQTRSYSGAAVSDLSAPAENATLEYTYTLTILAPDRVMVKDYNDIRSGVPDMMRDLLRNRTKEELQNETLMLAELKADVDEMLSYMQTPEVSIAIEYAYFPLSAEKDDDSSGYFDDQEEQRRYSRGTEEDYQALLTLKTPGYEALSLADFNGALLEWTEENPERMERISEDVGWEDFQIALTDEELSFVELTVFLSGMENGKEIQSAYAGQRICPYYSEELPQKITGENSEAFAGLYYQFSYSISDPETVTVGERDRQIGNMISAARTFWASLDTESALKMDEEDIVKSLEKIAEENSNDRITITLSGGQVHFERMDERAAFG